MIQTEIEPKADNLILALAAQLDKCSDDLSPAGDGCELCSCQDECCAFWERIEPERDNELSAEELLYYKIQFDKIRSRRQVRMRLTV